jgi:hypothetical protein
LQLVKYDAYLAGELSEKANLALRSDERREGPPANANERLRGTVLARGNASTFRASKSVVVVGGYPGVNDMLCSFGGRIGLLAEPQSRKPYAVSSYFEAVGLT